jgi:hypothetical protein
MMNRSLLFLMMILAFHLADAKRAHFTIEFVPTYRKGRRGRTKCTKEDIFVIQYILADVIQKDTGFAEPDRQKYLDKEYNGGWNPGFDFTYECPSSCEESTSSSKKEWCEILCEQDRRYHMGHALLEDLAKDLKDTLHRSSKGMDGPFNVNCLGVGSKLDLHLRVSVSPYIPSSYSISRR